MAEGGKDPPSVRNNLDNKDQEKKVNKKEVNAVKTEEKIMNQPYGFPDVPRNTALQFSMQSPSASATSFVANYEQYSNTDLKQALVAPDLTPYGSQADLDFHADNPAAEAVLHQHNTSETRETSSFTREADAAENPSDILSSYVRGYTSSSSTQGALSSAHQSEQSVPNSGNASSNQMSCRDTVPQPTEPPAPSNTGINNPAVSSTSLPTQTHAAPATAGGGGTNNLNVGHLPHPTFPLGAVGLGAASGSGVNNPAASPSQTLPGPSGASAYNLNLGGPGVKNPAVSSTHTHPSPAGAGVHNPNVGYAPQPFFFPGPGGVAPSVMFVPVSGMQGSLHTSFMTIPVLPSYMSGPTMGFCGGMIPTHPMPFPAGHPVSYPGGQQMMCSVQQNNMPGSGVDALTAMFSSGPSNATFDSRNMPPNIQQGQSAPSSEENNCSDPYPSCCNPRTRLTELRRPVLDWIRKKLEERTKNNWEALADKRGLRYQDICDHRDECDRIRASPFLELLKTSPFITYTISDLLSDVEKIHRKDILLDFPSVLENNK